MSILRFEPNVPLEVALKFTKGVRKPSTYRDKDGNPYPDQMMYTICGDDKIFVPLMLAEQIEEMGIEREELISICKTEKGKVTRWTVKRVSDAQEPPTKLEHGLQASVDEANAQRACTPSKAAPATPTTAPTTPVGGLPHEQSQSNHNPALSVASKLVASALIAAIDGLLVAADYARAKGLKVSLDLDFNAEDIRALAATTYIQAFKSPAFQMPAETKVNGHANGGASWPQH